MRVGNPYLVVVNWLLICGLFLAFVFYGVVFAVVFCNVVLAVVLRCFVRTCSRLFCFNCGFGSAVVLCGVVWARVFFSFLPYWIALGFIIVAGCGFVLAESSYCCVVCHLWFSMVRSLAGLILSGL